MPCQLQSGSSVAPPGTSAYHEESAAVVCTQPPENSESMEVKGGSDRIRREPVLPLGVVMVIMRLEPGESKKGCSFASAACPDTAVGFNSALLDHSAEE